MNRFICVSPLPDAPRMAATAFTRGVRWFANKDPFRLCSNVTHACSGMALPRKRFGIDSRVAAVRIAKALERSGYDLDGWCGGDGFPADAQFVIDAVIAEAT